MDFDEFMASYLYMNYFFEERTSNIKYMKVCGPGPFGPLEAKDMPDTTGNCILKKVRQLVNSRDYNGRPLVSYYDDDAFESLGFSKEGWCKARQFLGS